MRVQQLRITDFRNLETIDLDLGADVVVFWGDNGQGKTNLLEAVYLLANLRSFRNARRGDLIRWGCKHARVVAEVAARDIERHFEVRIEGSSRRARVDGKDPRSLASYFRGIRAVAFTPEDPSMVRGGPAGRRAFMDRGVFLGRPDHVDTVRQYSRLLDQKSALLRTQRADRTQIQLWNEQLAQVGAEIVARRASFVQGLRPHLDRVHDALVPGESALGVSYRTCCDPGDAEALAAKLDQKLDQELDRGQTLVGPHREDLVIRLDERDLRTFGSQGQVRSAALCLKLALLGAVTSGTDDPPLFLLDDLGSELDPGRNARLLELLADHGSQLLVATTTLDHVPLDRDSLPAYRVKDGAIVSQGGS